MITLEKDRNLTLIWLLAFTDQASARDFALDYRSILDAQKGQQHQHWIEARSNAVLVIIGPENASLTDVAPPVWQASTIASK